MNTPYPEPHTLYPARVVIATHNANKAGEMMTILGRRFPNVEFLTLADYPGAPEPEETGDTYAQNAIIKATSAALFTRELCLADDAGLEIDALEGQPGLYSRRFAGEETPFPEKMAVILKMMEGVPDRERTSRFRCCVAVAWLENGEVAAHVFEATCDGVIAHEPRGEGGFGYDPIFYLPDLERTMAQLSADEKHAVSHRGKVLAQVGDWLEARSKNENDEPI